jgi:hypothetical protein
MICLFIEYPRKTIKPKISVFSGCYVECFLPVFCTPPAGPSSPEYSGEAIPAQNAAIAAEDFHSVSIKDTL